MPIKKVTPADADGNPIGDPVTNLPALSKSDWGKSDISDKDAGRRESGKMVKKRRGKADRLDLEWEKISRTDAALALQTFDAEYTLVEYLDARQGAWVEKHFYTGDMQAQGWLPHLDSWKSVTLAIIRATSDQG